MNVQKGILRRDVIDLLNIKYGFDKTYLIINFDLLRKQFGAEGLVKITLTEQMINDIRQLEIGKPLEYILGTSEFCGHTFKIFEGVLIPRQDSEILVNAALKIIKQTNAKTLLEIGIGSGALIISILKGSKITNATGIDIQQVCIDNTLYNAKAILDDRWLRLAFIKKDFKDFKKYQFVDIIISNPPYIPKWQMVNLQYSVKGYESGVSLCGGLDGMSCYRDLFFVFARQAKTNCHLVIEIGYNLLFLIKHEIGKYKGILRIENIIYDYINNPRVVVIRKVNWK